MVPGLGSPLQHASPGPASTRLLAAWLLLTQLLRTVVAAPVAAASVACSVA